VVDSDGDEGASVRMMTQKPATFGEHDVSLNEFTRAQILQRRCALTPWHGAAGAVGRVYSALVLQFC
jgi:hypothetical protein